MTLNCFQRFFLRFTAIVFLTILSYASVFAQRDTLGGGDLKFIENKGQWEGQIAFKADLPCGSLYLEKNCLTYDFFDARDMDRVTAFKHLPKEQRQNIRPEDFVIKCHSYKVHFLGAREDFSFSTSKQSEDYNNYFTGSDPKKWASKVRNYREVEYHEIYAGIDLRLLQKGHNLKYEFYLHPGTDASSIKLQYEGADKISIQNGNLVVNTSVIDVVELKPLAYIIKDGERREIPCNYKLKGSVLSFDFPDGYDKTAEVIIDPVLIFSTFTGSTADNWGFTATYDSHGRVYSGGIVFGTGYPVSPGAYQMNFAGGSPGAYLSGCDAAIIKYDSSGTQRLFATYLGGSGNDLPHSMIVDANNNLLIYGTTGSSNFPVTSNAYDLSFNGGVSMYYDFNSIAFPIGIDIFVSKLSSDGTQLLASTFVGGNANDGLNDPSPLSYNYADGARGEISFDVNNNVYIVSTTNSTNFPTTTGVFQPSMGGGTQDGIIVKMDNNLSSIIWSSYLGGSGNDAVFSLAIDQNEDIYISGGTNSSDFPVTPGVLKPLYQGGSADGFITHINKDGNLILQSTYWGSSAYDQAYFVENDRGGKIYTFGQTAATGNTWVFNAAWFTSNGGQFISKLNSTLDTLIWSTAFGTGNGGPDISPTAFLVDLCDKIYLSGWGGNSLNGFGGTAGLPITGNAFQNTTDGSDFYLMVINDDASGLFYGTYFGGPYSMEHVDGGTSRFDRTGKIYQSVCAGCGGYDDFPTTPGAWSNTNNSNNCNNGVFKFDFMLPIIVADFDLPPVICAPSSITFNNTTYDGGPGFTSFWYFGDGTTSTQFEPTHLYSTSGTYYVTLVVSDTGTCNFADSITKPVLVLSNSSGVLPVQHICLGDNIQIGIPPSGDPTITYQWIPPATLNDPTLPNPIAYPTLTTNYTLLVSNGVCTDTLRQTVIVYNLAIDGGNDTLTCSGSVLLTAISSGGDGDFQWSSNPGFTDMLNSGPGDSTALVNITAETTYYILYSNPWCSAIDSVTIGFAVVVGTPYILNPACHDDSNGVASVHITNGIPPFTYLWSNSSTNDTISGLPAGTYTVTITDADSCVSIQTLNLVNPTPLLHPVITTNLPCSEACIGTITVNTSGSTPPYYFSWSNGQTSDPATGLCEGSYTVTITDSHNCIASDSAGIIVDYIYANMQVWVDDDTIYEGQTTGLHATDINGCTYTWTPGQYVANNGDANTMANPPVTTTFYLSVTDQYGCLYTDTITIYVIDILCDEPYIYVPNAFTPNDDENNDVFFLRTNQGDKGYLAIFNRWGEKLFETYDIKRGWDGTFKGKKCDPGVFVYYCEVICYNNQMFIKKGNVTLIR
jgi:gliding motility-associated-like protein